MYYDYSAYYSWMFGVLKYYDLCDLAAAARTPSMLMLAPTDPLFNPLPQSQATSAFSFTSSVSCA